MKLKGKIALVTGAAQGIGKAVAVALAKEGADIIVSDSMEDVAEKTAKEIAETGVRAKALKMNVADPADVETRVKEAQAEFGKIDILVNNAGITRDTLLIRMKNIPIRDQDLQILMMEKVHSPVGYFEPYLLIIGKQKDNTVMLKGIGKLV